MLMFLFLPAPEQNRKEKNGVEDRRRRPDFFLLGKFQIIVS